MSRNDVLLDRAALIAREAHRGQTDKSGQPYILHPTAVMLMVALSDEDPAAQVALLHDTVEDTWVTMEYLRIQGFSAEVLEAVDAITHRKGETNDDYYARVKANVLATRVKLADIAHNTDPRRMKALDAETKVRLTKKYEHALEVLNA